MLRIIGCVMIVFAGSMLGFLKSDGLFRRAKLLGRIITGLNLLKTDIGYGKKDLRTALLGIGKNHDIELFSKTAEELSEKGVKEALNNALAVYSEPLKEGDKEPIFALSENLGMTDVASQVSAIETAIVSLDSALKEAEEDYRRLGKMYRSVGVLGGLLVAIIFI